MKIIVSHDVDHLYSCDHWFRDLFFPKLWIRESLNLLKNRITAKEWFSRCTSCFSKKINYIPELLEFDLKNGVPSTFFFGMSQGLGMSYRPEEAREMIQFVRNHGFSVGVHGICYDSQQGIQKEKNTFKELMGFEPDGIRMHYVRFNENTFRYLDEAGYGFDSTEFDKTIGCSILDPYLIEKMWEFPVCVMDTYLPYNFEEAKHITLQRLKDAETKGCQWFTVLMHDVNYCDAYGAYKKWYEWFIHYCAEQGFEMKSFIDAINELG